LKSLRLGYPRMSGQHDRRQFKSSLIEFRESAQLAKLEPNFRRVQVIHVEGPGALDLIPYYAPYVHAFLLDSGSPGAAVPELGGTGRTMTGQSARPSCRLVQDQYSLLGCARRMISLTSAKMNR
jgi:hypothetical protein